MEYRSRIALVTTSLFLFSFSPALAQGNCVISGGVNNGLQIQNCPVIEQAPTPTFHVVQEYPIVKNADGTFTRSALINIDAPYVPGNMVAAAFGKTVLGLTISNKTMTVGGPGKAADGTHLFWISEPWGKYLINVQTSDEKTQPTFQIAFNVNINVNNDNAQSTSGK